MRLKRLAFLTATLILSFLMCEPASGVSYIQSPPLAEVIRAQVGNVKGGQYTQVPLITWGGDIATILANGNSAKTTSNSIFGQKGLRLNLVREDDFKKQVEAYLRGDTPYLRGTMGMINAAADAFKAHNVDLVVIYQMTWSVGATR